MDVGSQKCKKCDFVSHSKGLLRKHRFQNHVLGFEIDLQKHIEVSKVMKFIPLSVTYVIIALLARVT